MAQFAERLSTLVFIARPVIDQTGLPGVFDLSVKMADDNVGLKEMMIDGGAAFFTLIPQQTGLRLRGKRHAVEVAVVDNAERTPTAN